MASTVRVPSLRRRTIHDALVRVPLGLAVLLVIGLVLRVALMATVSPATWNNWDTYEYLVQARDGVFGNWFRPAGYPMFIEAMRTVWPSVQALVALQHALGLVTGVLAYATARRLGVPRALSLVPAGAVLLNFDQIGSEHTMLSETLFTPLVMASTYCVVRAATDERQLPWLLACGTAAGALVWTRTAGVLLIGVLALAALIGPFRRRLLSAVAVAGTGLALMLLYAGLNAATTGNFGLTRGGDWALYSRVAQFADCRQFTPPAGTEMLCETSDARTRSGPKWYLWEGGPARAAFGTPPAGSEEVGAFARTVIRHQPLTYARTVLRDSWRYINPDSHLQRGYSGNGPADLALDRRAPEVEQATESIADEMYGDEDFRVRAGLGALADVQHVMRFHGSLVAACLVLTLVGLVLGRGIQRWGIAASAAVALTIMVASAATMVYNARYGVPAVPLLAIAGVVGGRAAFDRMRSMTAPRRKARQQPASP